MFAIIFNSIAAFTSQINDTAIDTLTTESKISKWMNDFKKNNKLQIHRYDGPDSIIVFGSNKTKEFLTSVLIIDNKRKENRWYYYNADGVFRISTLKLRTKKSEKNTENISATIT